MIKTIVVVQHTVQITSLQHEYIDILSLCYGTYVRIIIVESYSDCATYNEDCITHMPKCPCLCVCSCSLQDVDGVASLESLEELYLAFNDISDISQISLLEKLEILDLEG